jgi:hypothetical protein
MYMIMKAGRESWTRTSDLRLSTVLCYLSYPANWLAADNRLLLRLTCERLRGIEPPSHPWQGRALPLSYNHIGARLHQHDLVTIDAELVSHFRSHGNHNYDTERMTRFERVISTLGKLRAATAPHPHVPRYSAPPRRF